MDASRKVVTNLLRSLINKGTFGSGNIGSRIQELLLDLMCPCEIGCDGSEARDSND
jgi:hypothetical protein